MKAQSGSQPDAVKIVVQGSNAIVWLRENVTEKTKDNDGTTETYYEYDEYRFTLPNRVNVETYVNDNLPAFLERERTKAFEELKAKMLCEADAKKKTLLDGGFTLNGITFDSDINARMAYAELGMRISQDPTYSTPWKASAGQWVTMNATLYQQIASAGEAHIGGVFAWLAGVQGAIAAATTVEELMEVEI